MKQKIFIASILLLGTVCVQANNYEVTSPDGDWRSRWNV